MPSNMREPIMRLEQFPEHASHVVTPWQYFVISSPEDLRQCTLPIYAEAGDGVGGRIAHICAEWSNYIEKHKANFGLPPYSLVVIRGNELKIFPGIPAVVPDNDGVAFVDVMAFHATIHGASRTDGISLRTGISVIETMHIEGRNGVAIDPDLIRTQQVTVEKITAETPLAYDFTVIRPGTQDELKIFPHFPAEFFHFLNLKIIQPHSAPAGRQLQPLYIGEKIEPEAPIIEGPEIHNHSTQDLVGGNTEVRIAAHLARISLGEALRAPQVMLGPRSSRQARLTDWRVRQLTELWKPWHELTRSILAAQNAQQAAIAAIDEQLAAVQIRAQTQSEPIEIILTKMADGVAGTTVELSRKVAKRVSGAVVGVAAVTRNTGAALAKAVIRIDITTAKIYQRLPKKNRASNAALQRSRVTENRLREIANEHSTGSSAWDRQVALLARKSAENLAKHRMAWD